MKPTTLIMLLLIALLKPPSTTGNTSYIAGVISTRGLTFLKHVLISKAVASLTPLEIPKIEESHNIPFLGDVSVLLSNVTLHQVSVSESSSLIAPGDSGVTIVVSGATANLSLNWHYSYTSGWLVPIKISDQGTASIQVVGMQVGLTFGLQSKEGSLKLSLVECGCFVKDLKIHLEGGASWLYQGLVDVFAGQIEAAVEQAINQKLREGILVLDSFLQNLPKEIPVDDIASLNVTVVDDPILHKSSIGIEIDGLFTSGNKNWKNSVYMKIPQPVSCDDPSKMIGMSIDEAVFQSASTLYFEAGALQWVVDTMPDKKFMNTAGWRFIIPQLYKKYPRDDMNFNFSLAFPPVIRISNDNIDVTASLDLIINVLEAEEVIPVACILLELQASGSVSIKGNNLGGKVNLNDFKLKLEWSKVGELKMFLIQPILRIVVETVLLPYANARLWKGFPLPMVKGFTLENAKIRCLDSSLLVCSDVSYTDSDHFAQTIVRFSQPH